MVSAYCEPTSESCRVADEVIEQASGCPLLADFVAKVENRTTLKISRKLIFGFLCCCVAL
jgi:hypothetical protein